MLGEWQTVEDWLRPGKDDDGRPSATVGFGGDHAYFFTDAWPTSVPGRFFEQGRSYTKFGAYTMWRFGDLSHESFARAREELIAKGYSDELFRDPTPKGADNGVPAAPPPPVGLRGMLLRGVEIEQQEPLTPLVKGLIDRNTICVLFGAYSSGKTFVAGDLGYHIATGRDWHGLEVTQGPVLYIVAEGAQGIGKRWRALADRYGDEDTPDLVWLPYPAQLSPKLNHLAELVEIVRELQPVAVFIDTFARATAGLDENDTGSMSEIVGALDQLRLAGDGLGPAIIPVHHTGWNTTRLRGSVALPAAADTVIRVEKSERDRADGTKQQWVVVTHEKAKESEELPPIHFELRGDPTPTLHLVDAAVREQLLEEQRRLQLLRRLEMIDLGHGATAAEWRVVAGVEPVEFYPAVKLLLARELVSRRDTKFTVTDSGKAAIGLGQIPGIQLSSRPTKAEAPSRWDQTFN